MNKIFQIARTEFLNSLRSKAFIIGALAVPLFSGIAWAAIQISNKQSDSGERRFAVIDGTGRLFGAIEAAAAGRTAAPPFAPESIAPGADKAGQIIALSTRVRDKELFGFFVIDAGLIEGGAAAALDYYTGTPTNRDLPSWVREVVAREVSRLRFSDEQIDREKIEWAIEPPPFREMRLAEDEDELNAEFGKSDQIRHFGVPFIMTFLMFVMVMTSAPALLTTALEERMNKISEFLVSAVSPFGLLMGKLAGAIGTAMVLATLYLAAGVGFAAHYGVLAEIPPSLFLWFYFFLALAVMTYGSICVAIGSVCNEVRDAQSLMMPVTLMMVIPVMMWQPVLQSPESAFAKGITYFPPATPVMLVLRNAIPPGLPWWELALGTLVCIAFMLATVWAAGKIFRIGILAQGQTPTLAQLARWVVTK